MAQSNLKAITKSLENENNANVTYFEKRNPQTKKLTRTSLIVEVPDSKVNAVKNAFEKTEKMRFRTTKPAQYSSTPLLPKEMRIPHIQ